MMYLALRNRGVLKILEESNLEGGSYDLALAERFGPLDVEANTARDWARLYMYGVSFWEAIPERAVYYFSQVAAAAPYLRDGSGWTARERYREVLIQYGDLFAAQENWCNAQAQYELAGSIRLDDRLQGKIVDAAQNCAPPTEIPTETLMETATPTLTPTLEIILPTETPTLETQPTATETPPPPLEPSPTSGEVTPTDTLPPPSETPSPPTETPAPPSETPGSDAQATLPTEVIIPEP
jgi:hypothetical protein